MMRRMVWVALIVGSGLVWQAAWAGTCELTVTRTSCKGKEKECFAKCDGKATCTRKEDAASADACLALAAKECPIARPDVTKAKVVRVVFDGKELTSNACDPKRPDYNKCE